MRMPKERINLDLRLRGASFLIQDKLVPHSPDGLYARLGAGELVAQPGDVYVNGTRIAVEVLAPDQAEQPLAVQDYALVAHEGGQQVELLGTEGHGVARNRDLAPGRVKPDVAYFEDALGLDGALA